MRNSPINNLRNARQYTESPYRGVANRGPIRDPLSPDRGNLNDAEYWRLRAKNLEGEMMGINEQLMFQARKLQKIEELEDKIEVLLAQNSHLVDENENLIKLIQQKKSEIDVWKSRFQGEYTQSNMAEAQKKKIFDHLNIKDQEHQMQIDKLLNEISRLHNQMEEMENMKIIQMNALKSKFQNQSMNQIQNLKRSQYGNHQLQQLNIRKLKDSIQEKNFEIQNLRRQAKLQNERLNAEIGFLKNEIKKIENQRDHQLDLIKTEHQNAKNNLVRAHRKNEEQMKNLHEAKVKRLIYDVEEKRNQIQETQSKLKKGGKETEVELNQANNDKSKLRQQIKESDNANRQRIDQITNNYQNQITKLRENNKEKELNLKRLYQDQIDSLKTIIQAKEQEIRRLIDLNSSQRRNQQARLQNIKSNNEELKQKLEDLIKHYEREIQLTKIKISQLYEADLQALRSNMRMRLSSHNRQRDNLRQLLQETRDRLAAQIQDKLGLRKQYEIRITQLKIKYQRQHQQLHDVLALHQNQIKNQSSKASLTHIEHNNFLQQQNLNIKQLMNEKRQLEKQIENKNKEIQSLNLRIQKMDGFHKRQIQKLQEDVSKLKEDHQRWLDNQDKETHEWNKQRGEFKETIHDLNRKIQQTENKKKSNDENLNKKLQAKQIEIAKLEGLVSQLKSKVGVLDSKNKVEVENIERTHLQTHSLMNSEKEKLLQAKRKELNLKEDEYMRRIKNLEAENDGMKKENEILRDHNQKAKIREAELGTQITNLLDSVNKRNKLQQHVINIGLSNNYFKNVAEIFRRAIPN